VLELDEKGYPILKLGAVPTKSGNPFHNPATGQFSFAPPGVRILKGTKFIKGLSTTSRKILFARAAAVKANQLAAEIKDGKLVLVLFRDGRLLHSFALAPPKGTDGEKLPDEESGEGQRLGITSEVRDLILEAARNIGLQGDSLFSFIKEELGIELSDGQKKQIQQMVHEIRLEDLISYLHQNMQKKLEGKKELGIVRILTPRGYLRKAFSNLEEEDVAEVISRLRAKGWTENVVQSSIINGLPKRFKDVFKDENKVKKGEDEIREIRKTGNRKIVGDSVSKTVRRKKTTG
jgi:hypothetical protein